jgi:hypothetical protein
MNGISVMMEGLLVLRFGVIALIQKRCRVGNFEHMKDESSIGVECLRQLSFPYLSRGMARTCVVQEGTKFMERERRR